MKRDLTSSETPFLIPKSPVWLTRRSSQFCEDLLFITEHILYSKIEKVPFIGSYYSLYVQSHERWDEWWDGKGRIADRAFLVKADKTDVEIAKLSARKGFLVVENI